MLALGWDDVAFREDEPLEIAKSRVITQITQNNYFLWLE